MSIIVNSITKQFGEQKAVDNISFNIDKNEIVGFLGPNGAGKSTTMKMITGFWKPNKGTIKVCDIDVATNPMLVKRKIGYLPEHNPLYLDMFVKEYLTFVARSYGISTIAQSVNSIIELTGLSIEKHKKIGQLSKGYRQRVGLAGALIHNPEVLILDEPTSGLDPNQIIEIRQLIKHIAKQKTVIFSTHIMQEVESLCERIIIINQGTIIIDDNLQHLKHSFQKSNHIVVVCKQEIDFSSLKNTFSEMAILQINKYTLETPSSTSEPIIQWLIAHHYSIQSLQEKSSSMEAIFKTLTTPTF